MGRVVAPRDWDRWGGWLLHETGIDGEGGCSMRLG